MCRRSRPLLTKMTYLCLLEHLHRNTVPFPFFQPLSHPPLPPSLSNTQKFKANPLFLYTPSSLLLSTSYLNPQYPFLKLCIIRRPYTRRWIPPFYSRKAKIKAPVIHPLDNIEEAIHILINEWIDKPHRRQPGM